MISRIKQKKSTKLVNDWRDPLYLNNLLSEEKSIHKRLKIFVNFLMPSVIENNEKSIFDKKIYPALGSNGFKVTLSKAMGRQNVSSVAYGLVARS